MVEKWERERKHLRHHHKVIHTTPHGANHVTRLTKRSIQKRHSRKSSTFKTENFFFTFFSNKITNKKSFSFMSLESVVGKVLVVSRVEFGNWLLARGLKLESFNFQPARSSIALKVSIWNCIWRISATNSPKTSLLNLVWKSFRFANYSFVFAI